MAAIPGRQSRNRPRRTSNTSQTPGGVTSERDVKQFRKPVPSRREGNINAPADITLGDPASSEGKWNRFWLAGFVAFTYILAFGRSGDGKPMIDGAFDSAANALPLSTGTDRMPRQVSVRAGVKGKLVQRGKRGRVERVGMESTPRRTTRRNTGRTVGVSAKRTATQTQAAKRQGTVQEA